MINVNQVATMVWQRSVIFCIGWFSIVIFIIAWHELLYFVENYAVNWETRCIGHNGIWHRTYPDLFYLKITKSSNRASGFVHILLFTWILEHNRTTIHLNTVITHNSGVRSMVCHPHCPIQICFSRYELSDNKTFAVNVTESLIKAQVNPIHQNIIV